METLLDGKGDHYSYRPLTIVVLTVTVKVATVTTFQMDGVSTRVSIGYQVQKGNLQQGS